MSIEENPKSINDLPSTIIETILCYLTYSDVTRIRGTCKHLHSACGHYLKRSIADVKDELYECMYEINKRFVIEKLPLEERGILLRGYNMLEILNLNLNTLIVLNRHILERPDSCLPVGFILDNFFSIMASMKVNFYGHWPTLGINLQNKINMFIESMEKCSPGIKTVIPLGVRAMDLFDMLMDVRYEICVIYDIPNNVSYVTGCYRLADSRFLSYLPDISFISECKDRTLTEEEADIIMKYLVLLVNVHNGLLTKSEQYRRELEFSRRSLLQDSTEYVYFDHWFESLKKPKREYASFRAPVHREILNPSGEVLEIYNNPFESSGELDDVDGGVRCLVQLKCSLDEAPIQIKQSFGYLKNDIILNEKSVSQVDSNVFENVVPLEGVYGVALKLEIRIPHNNPHMIDLEFKDGRDIFVGDNVFDKRCKTEVE